MAGVLPLNRDKSGEARGESKIDGVKFTLLPELLMPVDFPTSKNIYVMQDASRNPEVMSAYKQSSSKEPGLAYSVDEVRTVHKDAYKPWTQELEDELTVMYCEGVNVADMAKHFGRTKGAIRSRIKKLELEELYG